MLVRVENVKKCGPSPDNGRGKVFLGATPSPPFHNIVSFLVRMESLEAPPGTMPPTAPPGEVGVGASALPLADAPGAEELGPGEETESVPEEEEDKRRCLSEPERTPLEGGTCDGDGDTEDVNEVGGTAVEGVGNEGASVEAPGGWIEGKMPVSRWFSKTFLSSTK